METSCALCGRYIHKSEDPVRGKDGRIYHVHCYSQIKNKLEKDYEKKGMFSRIKRSFRQPEAYLGETRKGNNMRIKLSELKRLIREELLLEGIQGKTFCVTGVLSRPRTEFWRMIEDAGGIVHKGIKRDTDFLITGSDIGYNKIAKARSLGVKTITEREFLHIVRGGRPASKEIPSWRGSGKHSTERIGKYRGDYEKEPTYLDLVGESRKLIKELYGEEGSLEQEIKDSDFGEYLREEGVELISDSSGDEPYSNSYKVVFDVPFEELDKIYGDHKKLDIQQLAIDLRGELEVYNSEPGSYNRKISEVTIDIDLDEVEYKLIITEFYNV